MESLPRRNALYRPLVGTIRVARGLTQKAVSEKTGISQAVLSKVESGMLSLEPEREQILARVLQVPAASLMFEFDESRASTVVFHRKRSTLSVSKASQVRAILDLTRLQVEAILGESAGDLSLVRSPLPDDGYVTPEDVARDLRQRVGLGTGPLPNVVSLLESSGVAVVKRDLGSELIDALVSWPVDGRPIVLLADHSPADRQRFTLAHELGHAIMHQVPSEHQESEADRFASELLMPSRSIRDDLGNVSLAVLAKLKPVWRVSMAALLRRSRDLGQISESRYKSLNIEMSASGYRKREPVDILPDSPRAIQEAMARRITSKEDAEELAAKAHLLTDELFAIYASEAP